MLLDRSARASPVGNTALRELSRTMQTGSFDNSSAAADSDHSNANLAVLYEVSRQIYYRSSQRAGGESDADGEICIDACVNHRACKQRLYAARSWGRRSAY